MTENSNHIDPEEKALIQGCIDGDRSSQNKLYKMYSSKMFAVAFRYSQNREVAEDTFHEGFMRVYQNIAHFRNEGSLEGWIRRIIVNVAIRKFRKNMNALPTDRLNENHHEGSVYFSDNPHLNYDLNRMMQHVDNLPPAYKMVFNLYEFEGLKHHEIAEQLGISVGTSKSNLSRAKEILKNAIIQDEVQLKPIL